MHQIAYDAFQACNSTDKVLNSQLIGAIDETCIQVKRNKFVGCANATTWELLNHLHSNYAHMTRGDLSENEWWMSSIYDPNQLIYVLIDQIEDAIDHAAAWNFPWTPKQIVNTGCNLMFDEGVFTEEHKVWRKLPEADQTWDKFRTKFTQAH